MLLFVEKILDCAIIHPVHPRETTEMSANSGALQKGIWGVGSEMGGLLFTKFPFVALGFVPYVQNINYSKK